MGRVIGDAKLRLDQLCDTAAGPDCTPKAEGFCPLTEQLDELSMVVRGQQGGRTGRWVVIQCLDPVQGGTFEPLADRALGDAQGVSNVLLGPSFQMQVPGTEAAAFVPAAGGMRIWCAHELRAQHIPTHDY